jgi:EmrB/QacA subfamily drug resistance transporter
MPERKWWTLATVCVGIFMLLLDITIVNIALPDLARELHASFSDLQWVIDAYALSLAALLLIAGSLGDLGGHRLAFLVGLVVFSLSSLACGLAQDPVFLIAFRAVQGVGGAAMFASSLALIANEYQGRERGIALGAWGAVAGAAVAIGPLVGGAIISAISWRWIFFINVPIGALACAATVWRLGETRRHPGVRPDWAGFVALACGLLGIVYGLIRGNPDGWTSGRVLGALIGGVLLLVLFVVLEWRQRQPMLDLRLFRAPAVDGAAVGAFAIASTAFAMLLYLTLYLQDVLGYSPFQTGIRFLPWTALILVVAPITGRLSAHVPLRVFVGGGLAFIAGGLALMTRVDVHSSWTVLLPGFVLLGIGSGMANPALASASIGTVSLEDAGVGSGIMNTFRQVGIAVGIAALGAIFQSTLPARQLQSVQSGGGGHANERQLATLFVTGFDRILWVAAAFALVGAIASALLLRTRDLSAAHRGEAPAPVGGR